MCPNPIIPITLLLLDALGFEGFDAEPRTLIGCGFDMARWPQIPTHLTEVPVAFDGAVWREHAGHSLPLHAQRNPARPNAGPDPMHPLPGRKNAAAQAQTVTGKIPPHPLPEKKLLLAGQTSPRYLGQPPIRLRFYPVKNPPAQTAYSGIQHMARAYLPPCLDIG